MGNYKGFRKRQFNLRALVHGARWLLACFPQVLIVISLVPACWAHGIVGNRMFIEPLFTEDANIKNELDLPRAEFLTLPDGQYRTFEGAFEKALYPGWSVIAEQSHIYHHPRVGQVVSGFAVRSNSCRVRDRAHWFPQRGRAAHRN